jgi:hypothetical protein
VHNAVPIGFPNVQAAPPECEALGWALLTAAKGGMLRWCGETPQLLFTPEDPVVVVPAGLVVLGMT